MIDNNKLMKILVENYHVNFGPRDEMLEEAFAMEDKFSNIASGLGVFFMILLIATFWM